MKSELIIWSIQTIRAKIDTPQLQLSLAGLQNEVFLHHCNISNSIKSLGTPTKKFKMFMCSGNSALWFLICVFSPKGKPVTVLQKPLKTFMEKHEI